MNAGGDGGGGGGVCFALRVLRSGVVGHWLHGFLQHGIGRGVFSPDLFTFPPSLPLFFFCAALVLCYSIDHGSKMSVT